MLAHLPILNNGYLKIIKQLNKKQKYEKSN